ncbi:MAG: 2-hydroxyacyl-CoA dehydratase family protein [Planctomycetaceae bacterium]|nr:2-hydroxyacyl-CoA dehydratase family protein [Planctomycetaceae bacterium]
MTAVDPILKNCRSMVLNPHHRRAYLQSVSARSCGIIGYFSNYIPAEIIAAAGFHPLRLIGCFGSVSGPALCDPMCSFVQDFYATQCSGLADLLTGLVFPNSCDSLKVLRQVWQTRPDGPQCWTLDHPVNTDGPALLYLTSQLRRLASELAAASRSTVSDEKLHAAITEYNTIRGLLRQCYAKVEARRLRYSDLLAVATAGLMLDRNEFTRMLQEFAGSSLSQPLSGNPVMLAGPLTDDLELVGALENHGACIVGDSVTNGWRYCSQDIATGGDIYTKIAQHILSQASPTAFDLHRPSLAARAAELGACGIIFLNQERCEPHVHSYVKCAAELEQQSIKTLLIEVEHGRPGLQARDLMRIESFMELL